MARTRVQNVRTTAYTHSEVDHIQHGRKTALGTTLAASGIRSAAADWSRWPAGTIFRIRETGEVYRVEDYGWALAGTNTIDLYKPSRSAMNHWGVRRVTIEHIYWGDPERSRRILEQRSKYKHIQRMLAGFNKSYPKPPKDMIAATPEAPAALPIHTAVVSSSTPLTAPEVRIAQPVE